MTARCKNCSSKAEFRNQRGNRLSDMKCRCGGEYEIMSVYSLLGKHPFKPEETYKHPSWMDSTEYHWVYKNSMGDVFYMEGDKFITLPDATKKQNNPV